MVQLIVMAMALGVGLAMDAFAVSMSNGLKEKNMKISKAVFISLVFGIFQAIMPLIGYLCGNMFLKYISKFIPYIALIILSFLGIKMIVDSIKNKKNDKEDSILTIKALLLQAIATSIDALSTGIAFSNYNIKEAILCVSIIGLLTFILCLIGVYIGKAFGLKFSKISDIAGGVILILIGLEIFIQSFF